MKNLKKLFTLLIALCMLFAGAVSVAADNYSPIPGGDTQLKKYLVVNEDAEIPEAEFEFTVTAGASAEATADTVKVWAGLHPELVKVNGTAESGVVNFVVGEEATSALAVEALGSEKAEGKKAAVKTIALDFSGVEFAEPGVYRYLVTETDPVDPIKAVDSKVTTVDVYVEDNNGVLEVVDYVAYEGSVGATAPKNRMDLSAWLAEHPEPVKGQEETDEAFEARLAQWVADKDAEEARLLALVPNGAEAGEKDDKFVNELASANIKFGKEVTGNQGSKDQYFKFTLELSNLGKGTVLTLDMSEAENGVAHENTATSYSKATMEEANKRDDMKAPKTKYYYPVSDVKFAELVVKYGEDELRNVGEGHNEVGVLVETDPEEVRRNMYVFYFGEGDEAKAARDAFAAENPREDMSSYPEVYLAEFIDEIPGAGGLEGQQIVADAQGNATVEVYLHDGMYVTLKGLPEGATYSLTEENAAGYEKIAKITQAVNGTRAYEDELSGTIGAKMEEKPEHWTFGGQEYATLAEANAAAVDAGEEMPAEGQPANGVEHHEASLKKAADQDVYTGYTNNREGVIPTGVITAIGGGVALVAIAGTAIFLNNHKKEEEE